MANGLLDLLGGLGTTPPAYLEGLLGAQQTEDLRKQSIGTGLANALVGYLAMPKNKNLGLGRILAGTAQAGMQGAQGVYTGATADYLQAQQSAEAKRKQDQQALQQTAIQQAAKSSSRNISYTDFFENVMDNFTGSLKMFIANYVPDTDKQKQVDEFAERTNDFQDTISKLIQIAYKTLKKENGRDLHLGNLGFFPQKPDEWFYFDM
jgi:hypothetical protein